VLLLLLLCRICRIFVFKTENRHVKLCTEKDVYPYSYKQINSAGYSALVCISLEIFSELPIEHVILLFRCARDLHLPRLLSQQTLPFI
jgi:hypothetical protein